MPEISVYISEPEQQYDDVTPGEQGSGLTAIALYDYQASKYKIMGSKNKN